MKPVRKGQPFSDTEDEFIRLHYGVLTYEEIAAQLGRTYDAVKSRARLKGLCSDRKQHGWSNNFTDQHYMERFRRNSL